MGYDHLLIKYEQSKTCNKSNLSEGLYGCDPMNGLSIVFSAFYGVHIYGSPWFSLR